MPPLAVVLPKMKLFLKKCYLSWIRKRYCSCVKIQSIIAMYSGKVMRYKNAGQKYIVSALPDRAALLIQKVDRAHSEYIGPERT